jgi:hypothetical protein
MMLFRPKDITDQQVQKLGQYGIEAIYTEGAIIPIPNAVKRVVPNRGEARIERDGYDFQEISCTTGVTEIVIRDRYYNWIDSKTPGVTIEDQNGFRLVKCKEGTTQILLTYGSSWLKYLAIFWTLMLVPFVLLISRKQKHESDATTS